MHRPNPNTGVLIVIWILVFQPSRDRIHFGARFFESNARFQSSPYIQIIAVANGSRINVRPNGIGWNAEAGRNPKFAIVIRLEIRRHNADDGIRDAIEGYLPTDDAGVASVATFPQF